MAATVCFIALAPGAYVTPAEIFDRHSMMWPAAPPLSDLETGAGVAKFKIGTANGFIAKANIPIPQGDLEGPCKASFIWPTAAQDLQAHDSHFVVSVTECGAPLAAASALTRLTAAILAACPGAIGVYDGDAGLVAPSKLYIETAAQLKANGYPLLIWMSVRLARSASGACGHTVGLAALGLPEIEVPESKLGANELAPKLYDLALDILKTGARIKDGDTVGQGSTERIKVSYGRSSFGLSGRVMRLQFEKKGLFGYR